jgi:serine protease
MEEYMSRLVRSLLFVFALVALTPLAHAQTPYASAFSANTFTSGNQRTIATATGANGDVAILWSDAGRGDAEFIARYNAAGQALQSDEWYVGLDAVDVAVSGNGSYAILYNSTDGSEEGVFVTVYNRSGSVIVPKFRVNDTTVGRQSPQAIAMNANGQFVVTWLHNPTNAMLVKRFNANGTAVMPETLVQTAGPTIVMFDAAIDNAANFTVTWSQLNPSSLFDVYAKRYSSTGSALGSAFLVNNYTTHHQISPQIAMSGTTGAFVIVWTSWGQASGSAWSVHGRRFNGSGAALGSEFQISTQTSELQEFLSVAMASNGSFMATWTDDNRSADPSSVPHVLGRSYDPNGVPYSAPFNISLVIASTHSWFPYVTMSPSGDALVSWGQISTVTGDYEVYAQRFMPGGVVVQELTNGQTVPNLSGGAGSWRYFKITVPAPHNTLNVTISGGSGDADLYVRRGALPTLTAWDGRPYLNGNNEGVNMVGWPPGDWYIAINGYMAYSGLTLQATSY